MEEGTTWNNSIFWEDEAKAILSIPLGKNWVEDKLIWAELKMGFATLKVPTFQLSP